MSKSPKPAYGPPQKRRDYLVGRGRPPVHSRFQQGRSGNPSGRPRGRQNISTIVGKMARKMMTITEGGRRRRVPRYEALQLVLWNKALKGDYKAAIALHQFMRDAGMLRAEVEDVHPVTSQEDQQNIQDYFAKASTTLRRRGRRQKSDKRSRKDPQK
jgi:hypothetical protein